MGVRTDTGVCEVARDTARGLGLPSSIQLALYHVFESWAGGAAPGGLQGDSIPIASRVARVAVEAAFFSHLGGVDASIAAVRARAGMILDPTLAETFVADARDLVAEARAWRSPPPVARGRAGARHRGRRCRARRRGEGVR